MHTHRFSFLLLILVPQTLPAAPPTSDIPTPPPALAKPVPENIEDLKAIQAHTRKVLEKVIPCTVGVEIGGATGSGVIVSKDGLVLTAGHVSGQPDRKCTIILHDGKRVEAKSLGNDHRIDSGMFQITTPGEYPFREMGNSAALKAGQWCVAVGHPNGFSRGRPPVVRVGRLLDVAKTTLTTDCTLVGGDSGGPLFDMEGKIIGIHSRINTPINSNVHVPVDTYRENYARLMKGEELATAVVVLPYLGVTRDDTFKGCKLHGVTEGSPADKAGLKAGDVVVKFGGNEVKSYEEMLDFLGKKKPNDEVELLVKRGEEMKTLKVKLGKRS